MCYLHSILLFFFNDTATTEIYTLSLHDALPISSARAWANGIRRPRTAAARASTSSARTTQDRKSTRLNSSHSQISYAVFCLKKKNLIGPVLTAAVPCLLVLKQPDLGTSITFVDI